MDTRSLVPSLRLPSLFPPPRQVITAPPSSRVPVIRSLGEYQVDFEQVGDCTFVHVIVYRWSASVKAKFSGDIEQLGLLHGGPFYVLRPKTDKKLRKFCLQFGFEHAMDMTTREGIDSEILIKRIR